MRLSFTWVEQTCPECFVMTRTDRPSDECDIFWAPIKCPLCGAHYTETKWCGETTVEAFVRSSQ